MEYRIEVQINQKHLYWFNGEPVYTNMFVQQQQRYFNNVLKQKGYVFLRDIYEILYLPISKTCLTTGWLRDKHEDLNKDVITIDMDMFDDYVVFKFNTDGDITEYFK